MVLVQKTGQYPDSLYDFGHIPGVSGGAIGVGAKLATKYSYRGAKWLARRFLKPKKYTYSGAVGRGIGVGTVIVGLLPNPETDPLDGTFPTTDGQKTNNFQQRNRRQRRVYRDRRCDNRHRHRQCC